MAKWVVEHMIPALPVQITGLQSRRRKQQRRHAANHLERIRSCNGEAAALLATVTVISRAAA